MSVLPPLRLWRPEKLSSQFLGLIVMSPGHFGSFTLSLYRVENRVCLSYDMQVVGAV
jgi:hypothetical protein